MLYVPRGVRQDPSPWRAHHLLEETDSQTFNGLGRTSGFVGGAERKKIYNMIQEKT
jgi:hypothetical protein